MLNSNNNDTLLNSFCRYSNERLIWIREEEEEKKTHTRVGKISPQITAPDVIVALYELFLTFACTSTWRWRPYGKRRREVLTFIWWRIRCRRANFVFPIFSLSSLVLSSFIFLCSHRILTAIIDRSNRHKNGENMYMIRLIFCFFFYVNIIQCSNEKKVYVFIFLIN